MSVEDYLLYTIVLCNDKLRSMKVTGDGTIAAVTQVSHKGACCVIHYPWWLLLTYWLNEHNGWCSFQCKLNYEKIKNNS